MTFYVGQKVVFVGGAKPDDDWKHLPPSSLKIGDICTIREIDPLYQTYCGCNGIRVFEELADPVFWEGELVEPAFLAIEFRPLIERKTDISALTALLNPANHKPLLPVEKVS